MQVKFLMFPYTILLYVNQKVDKTILKSFCTDDEMNQLIKQVAFTLGSFILPKYMIKNFQMSESGEEN